jgi:hypothetical protein
MGIKCAILFWLKKCPSLEITASKVSNGISLILAWFEDIVRNIPNTVL